MCKLYLLLLLYKTLSHKISVLGTKIACCGCKKFHILGEIRLFLFIAFGYDLGLIPMHYSSACDQINYFYFPTFLQSFVIYTIYLRLLANPGHSDTALFISPKTQNDLS